MGQEAAYGPLGPHCDKPSSPAFSSRAARMGPFADSPVPGIAQPQAALLRPTPLTPLGVLLHHPKRASRQGRQTAKLGPLAGRRMSSSIRCTGQSCGLSAWARVALFRKDWSAIGLALNRLSVTKYQEGPAALRGELLPTAPTNESVVVRITDPASVPLDFTDGGLICHLKLVVRVDRTGGSHSSDQCLCFDTVPS